MNSKQKGNITELETMLAFAKTGFNVLIPYGDCERYDFVVDAGKRFYKIQCKTAKTEDDGASFRFSCRSSNRHNGGIVHRHYTKDDIDFFATSFENEVYLIPVEECGADKKMRIIEPKNGQTRGVTWAKDYRLEDVVNRW